GEFDMNRMLRWSPLSLALPFALAAAGSGCGSAATDGRGEGGDDPVGRAQSGGTGEVAGSEGGAPADAGGGAGAGGEGGAPRGPSCDPSDGSAILESCGVFVDPEGAFDGEATQASPFRSSSAALEAVPTHICVCEGRLDEAV